MKHWIIYKEENDNHHDNCQYLIRGTQCSAELLKCGHADVTTEKR